MPNIENILEIARERLKVINESFVLNELKIEFLGKKSLLSQEMKKIAQLHGDERKMFAEALNAVKESLNELFEEKTLIIRDLELKTKFQKEAQDLTIPARKVKQGSIHPITQAMDELLQVFSRYGFNLKTGPSIETSWCNFGALNFPKNHPAMSMHDTFYVNRKDVHDENMLLRTHTSPIQIREMEKAGVPIRIIAPGRTYRSDCDMTHTPMFHQIEGLVIDKDINIGHMKYVISQFIRDFFEQSNIEFRFRSSFFPFTEPSCEVDIKLKNSNKWLEVLGCGMVHPNVLKNVNVDTNIYRGFAFGIGVERFAMLKYGIKDLRQFFEGDIRWLNHYNFSAFDIPNLAWGLTK